jgi:predicted phage-related endonuclease
MMNEKMNALAEYLRMKDEIEAEIDALKDEIKAYMAEHGTDTVIGTGHKATWRTVKSNRFDSAGLKKDAPELYAAYTVATESKRFTFN